ncbi:SDR family oxidoreductase [Cryptosporangium phraense]|uniref:SDR family oxidoreductase n=1 Tax=Cryptosporangium phraense TaxID=2593070 RepID=A0A545AY15_9ACTN|nr:SDR family oxidoreductase [Cryptosporangium phraense]
MIVVTGATGQLGRLVVRNLLDLVAADQIAVLVRDPARATHPAEHGIEVRVADHDVPASLADAFQAGDRVLLISGNQFGARRAQHDAVIDAAKAADVTLLAYTSILGGPDTRFVVADDHHATERAIEGSGLPFSFLRNGWYTENYTAQLPTVLEHGAVVGTAAPGSRLATATRNDYAAAAAAVLAGNGHENTVYELSGDEAWSLHEYATEVSRQSGQDITYRQIPAAEYRQMLAGSGLPEAMIDVFLETEDAIERGELATVTGDLRRLIGRPSTSLAEVIRDQMKACTDPAV